MMDDSYSSRGRQSCYLILLIIGLVTVINADKRSSVALTVYTHESYSKIKALLKI